MKLVDDAVRHVQVFSVFAWLALGVWFICMGMEHDSGCDTRTLFGGVGGVMFGLSALNSALLRKKGKSEV